ncbi:SCO family protein [Suttonella ornithocola]|uniref:SCO1/SenC n=1 Tax=Suttonella ornithocola TaxID=279832 RepID=A0A380MSE2_9GAMM|nr:SCO family protein [Suttonella ornithocola]SUO95475.1 SCO1/SenC [Suttonella ornithocola]
MKTLIRVLLSLYLSVSLIATAAPTYQYQLQSTDGRTLTQADFPNQYQLIAFGFTHCPDVCPTTLYDFKQVLAKIAHPERLQMLFITIDPDRDNLDLLSKYIGYFDKRILGLRGNRAATDQAVENFNASYGYQIDGKKVAPENLPEKGNYTVYHSTLIYLLNRKGKLIDVFDYQSGAENLRKGVEAAIKEDQKD